MAVENQDITARQRARNDRGGKATSALIYGTSNPNAMPEPEPVKKVTKNPQKDNYRNPSEFYAGPSQPGKVHGARRNEAAQKDTVAVLLTDEGLMSAGPGGEGGVPFATRRKRGGGGGFTEGGYGEAIPPGGFGPNKVPKAPLAERTNVDYVCHPVNPDPQWRSGVKMTHAAEPMDAPFFEDMDPKPARETNQVSGKRRIRGHQERRNPVILDPSKPLNAEEKAAAAAPTTSRKTNRANQSVNVMCLNAYSADQLHEPRPIYRPQGPRKFTAPDMPPAPHSRVTAIKSHAKDEHDVLGTGRWGTPEEPKHEGVGKGSCRPKYDSANLFAGDQRQIKRRNWVPPSEARKPTAQQKKQGGQPNLLKYYDPNIDPTMEQAKPKPHGNRANEESKLADANDSYHAGRAPGAYAKNGQSTSKYLW